MPIFIAVESEIIVGSGGVVEGAASEGGFLAVFEDDCETGYFYAVDTSKNENPIEDALHIYNVADVIDKDKPSLIKIGWSQDSRKVVLFINGYPHAVFDFEARRGYCRTGFPPAPKDSPWGLYDHNWSDETRQLFAS